MNKLLQIKNLSVSYGAVQALRDVSLHVDEHEIVALIGANGAGKSTLMMSLFGQPRAQAGQILFAGQNLLTVAPHRVASFGLTLVPEGRRVFPQMTVVENLLSGQIHLTAHDHRPDLARVYEVFPILQQRSSQRAGTLSGGEQQMLAIGRGLMARPKLLLLDEPSLGLAPLIIKQIFEVLAKIATTGTTIFFVEQNANLALNFAQRGYVLVNGRIAMSGSCQQLLTNDEIKKAYLGG